VMEIIANSRNLESYSLESKQCLGGGELEPDWEYCETVKAILVPDDTSSTPSLWRATGKFPATPRFQSATHGGHASRLKLLSIKPNKTCVVLKTVVVVVKENGTSTQSPISATSAIGTTNNKETINDKVNPSTNSSSTTNAGEINPSSSSTSNNRSDQTPPPSQGPAAAPLSAESLRNMLTSAMFAIDAKVSAACQNLESKLDKKISRLEDNVKELKHQVVSVQQLVTDSPKKEDNIIQRPLIVQKIVPTSDGANEVTEKEKEEEEEDSVFEGNMEVSEWNHTHVTAWLQHKGFSKYIPSLELVDALVDGNALLSLTKEDLSSEELGIDFEDIDRLSNELAALSPSSRCASQPHFFITDDAE
jgi:hypothetical protein